MEVHKDEIKGGLKQAEGRMQKAWGELTDDPVDEDEGEMKQVEGKMEQTVGKIKKGLHNLID